MTFEEFEATLEGERLELWLKKIKPKIRVEGECWIWTGCVVRSNPVVYAPAARSVRQILSSERKIRLASSCGSRLCICIQHTVIGGYKTNRCKYGHSKPEGNKNCLVCALIRSKRRYHSNPEIGRARSRKANKDYYWRMQITDQERIRKGLGLSERTVRLKQRQQRHRLENRNSYREASRRYNARKKIRKWVLIALLNHYSSNDIMSGSA